MKTPDELVFYCLNRIELVPMSKVTLSVAVQQNKELEKQQAAIQQVKLHTAHCKIAVCILLLWKWLLCCLTS